MDCEAQGIKLRGIGEVSQYLNTNNWKADDIVLYYKKQKREAQLSRREWKGTGALCYITYLLNIFLAYSHKYLCKEQILFH